MTVPILGEQDPRPARSLIVAPRMPAKPKRHTGDPFTSDGDIVADCGADGCGYHVMGPRADVKQAMEAHRRMYHVTETHVVLLNHPRM